jgi:hypothetical protein
VLISCTRLTTDLSSFSNIFWGFIIVTPHEMVEVFG